MKRYFLVILFIFLIVIVLSTAFFIKKERAFNENLRLQQKNEELRAQIQKLSIINPQPLAVNPQFFTAKVFSTYPFNIKNQITINAGEKQGIRKLAPVLLGDNILVGQVIEVSENFSVVRTIFDPQWQLPVRIGKEEINGLFQGGGEPRVVLIGKEKTLQAGDLVYSASQEFPYGLKIGEIAEIKETSAGVFKEAILKMPFNPNELREVNIIK